MNNFNGYGWQNWASSWITTSATSGYPGVVYTPQAIPPVLASPAAALGDREWLDAQITEVCDLAAAA